MDSRQQKKDQWHSTDVKKNVGQAREDQENSEQPATQDMQFSLLLLSLLPEPQECTVYSS